MGNAALPFQWKRTTRFTMKNNDEHIQENHDEGQQHEHHVAHRARGLRQPQQPTPQQIAEHNLTNLPYRNWCPICVQGKGRQDNYKKQQSGQPVIQVDFAYMKSQQGPKTIPVLTAVDVTTQLCMAVMVPDKPSMMDYMVNNLQAFIFERGRTQGILQSDNEDTLNTLLKATAAKVGSMTVRHAPSYSSSQGSVERLHRTMLGQVRVVKRKLRATIQHDNVHEALPTTLDSTTCSMDGKSLRHPLRRLHKLRTPLGKKLRAGDLRIWPSHNARNFQKQIYGCINASGSEKFPKPEKTRSQRKEAYKRYEPTRLQIRLRTTFQSFRHTWGGTTEHLQPVICNTVGHSTTIVREETIYARLRTTDERDGRHRRGTRNKTTTRYVTSTTSVDIDVKFTTTTG